MHGACLIAGLSNTFNKGFFEVFCFFVNGILIINL